MKIKSLFICCLSRSHQQIHTDATLSSTFIQHAVFYVKMHLILCIAIVYLLFVTTP